MSLRQSLIWLVVLVVAFAILLVMNSDTFPFRQDGPELTNVTAMRTPPQAPIVTPERTVQAIDNSKMFSMIISYTDQGFEPKAAVTHVGDKVRFTNNSAHDMWITTAGKTCGAGVLDTCKALPPGEYYEYTFIKSGNVLFVEKGTNEEGSINIE
jgi:plastocyanin